MNVLFLSLKDIKSLEESNIYIDLLNEFIKNGHHVDIVSPIEKRNRTDDRDITGVDFSIYKPHIGNITNTGFLEKGVSIFKYRKQMIRCIKSKIGDKQIDLFLVAVPPVTVNTVIKYVNKKYQCKSYLLLKDIWPASLFDLQTTGGSVVKRIVCKILRVLEKDLYNRSDFIGCLSPANVEYVRKNNKYLDPKKVHVNPNSIVPLKTEILSESERKTIRNKYGIPTDRRVFIYGGTLGVGQNVAHIVECLKACNDLDCHFVISGKGIQYDLLKRYKEQYEPENLTLINGLPKEEYDLLMQSCDVGMVFLRYTAQTPNIPSRILSYMQYGLPIISCTDPTSDLNSILEDGRIGWGCMSNDPKLFRECVQKVLSADDLNNYSVRSKEYLKTHFNVSESYNIIINSIRGINVE